MSTLTPQNPVPPRSVNVPVRHLAIRRQGRYNVSNTKPSWSGPGTLVLRHHEPPSLPCEILQAIFTEAVRPSSADIDLEETILLRSTILGCSQVCQIWRLAARDYSLLWIHAIDPRKHSPEVVADLLELSRPHLIEVGHRSAPFFITTERHCDVLLKFRPHRGRIREWNVFLSPSLCPLANTRWIFGSLGWASSRCIRILRWSGAITSPGGALSTISSSLFKLELRNTNLALPQWIDLSNLTELSVHSKAPNSIKLSLQEWFVLLKGTYRLRFLGLHHAMKTDNELDAAMGQLPDDVTLPELQLCSLTESSWDGAFMALIVFLVINKPFTCGLQLDLPRWADLVDEDGGNDLSADEIKQTIGVVATSFQEYAGHHTSDTLPGVTPRVEISVKYENPGIQVTFGTVPNPATTLDWNGYRGAAGVEQYLDSYFGSPIHASSPRHPPISVTLYNPDDADMVYASIFNAFSLHTSTSARVTIDLKLSQSIHLDPVSDAILASLSRMKEARTLVLNKGALAALVPVLQEAMYMDDDEIPRPHLPKLKCIIVESTTPKADSGIVGAEVWEVLLHYVEWRNSVGFPVTVSWCAGVDETW